MAGPRLSLATKKRPAQPKNQSPQESKPATDDVQIFDIERYGEVDWEAEQREWLAQQFEALTSKLDVITPSGWAEDRRYLPPSVTSMPGYYRFDVAPYLKEILDCLSINSPVRFVAVMKGVQLGLTTGVIENAIGYFIEHVKTAPMMLITADGELAKSRMDSNITPMLIHSELTQYITSASTKRGKTGWTDKLLEWLGGGSLIPIGAQNANKFRQQSIQALLRDEIDAWPLANKDGDPLKLAEARTKAYEETRKVVDVSTPVIKGASKIEEQFRLGDQRYYFVCCLGCGHAQTLRWRRTNKETGEITGITWETKDGKVVPGSVRYKCEQCGHPHINDDKTRLLAPENGAEWRPTAQPASPDNRSYHINALYSPVGMQTWESCVKEWLEAWDEERSEAKDVTALQTFYNNVLGESFEPIGDKVRFDSVSSHRRQAYRFGEIPNKFVAAHTGGPVMLLTAAVDIHKDNLAVAVFGWCKGRRAFLIDYWRFEGDPQQLDDAPTWGRLRSLIEGKEYVADDGKHYRVAVTLIDSGYLADQAYQFAFDYQRDVYPIKGREAAPKDARHREFSEFTTPMGTVAFGITVDIYKERWSSALRRQWDGLDLQPNGHFNAPLDVTDKQLKELTVESKRPRVHKATGRRIGFEWHRPSGSSNEMWDLLVYNAAALDMLAASLCVGQLEMEQVNWEQFWFLCEHGYKNRGPMYFASE